MCGSMADIQSAAAEIRRGKKEKKKKELECGSMPNLMVALPNIGGALCSTPQSLADAHYLMPCSNAAKTQNPLKFTGVPQTRQQILAATEPKFTILSQHVEEVLLLNKFFSIVDTCLNCEDMARQSCAMVPRWRFFCVLYLQRAACSAFQTCILNSH